MKNSVWELLKNLEKKEGITEIIVNSPSHIFIERAGDLIRLDINLKSEDIMSFCVEVAKMNNSSFGPKSPIVDGVLPDGSRINIISPMYTNSGPAITIRKYLKNIKSFDSLAGEFGITAKWIKFFKTLVWARKNIIISGGTGNGKTTFMNLLIQEISKNERIITIEDTRELTVDIPNTIRLLAQKNLHSVENPLTTRDLLKNTLRMRPDRIIIGEVRGEEAFDLLQAMNTGHDGSMCTLHSNSPVEALSRLENLFLFSGYDLPIRVVRKQVTTALDYIIQLDRNKDGKRIVSQVSEIVNMEGETILTQEIGTAGENGPVFTGLVPQDMASLVENGLNMDFFIDT